MRMKVSLEETPCYVMIRIAGIPYSFLWRFTDWKAILVPAYSATKSGFLRRHFMASCALRFWQYKDSASWRIYPRSGKYEIKPHRI